MVITKNIPYPAYRICGIMPYTNWTKISHNNKVKIRPMGNAHSGVEAGVSIKQHMGIVIETRSLTTINTSHRVTRNGQVLVVETMVVALQVICVRYRIC